MGFFVSCGLFLGLLCLFNMGGGVWCDCDGEILKTEGVNYTLTKGLQTGSTVVYQCTEGYYPYPTATRHCQLNNMWNPQPKPRNPQRCKMVECPDPNTLENGNILPPEEQYFVNNETTVECYSGFKLYGSPQRYCLPNGKWSGRTPICRRVSHDVGSHCPDPGVPPGASRRGNHFGFSDRVRYTCNNNLILVGSSERECLDSGQWSGIEPACYYRHTYDTPQEISEEFGGAIKSSLTTLESPDNTQGERKIRIPKSGVLNIYIGMDVSDSIDDKHIEHSKNAIMTLIDKISAFSVSPNYQIDFFSSNIDEIVNIIGFFNRTVNLRSVIESLRNFVADRNTPGTDLTMMFKKFYHQISLIKATVGDEKFKEHRHVIIVFTDGGYNMGGSPVPTVKKIKNMVYMNPAFNEKNNPRDDYLDIYVFAIGTDIIDENLMPLTTVRPDEKHYFRLENINKELEQTFDSIIDETEVVSLCGLHRDYNSSKSERNDRFPWAVSVIVLVEGGVIRNCLGSLVTPRFVLTAAHCLPPNRYGAQIKVKLEEDGYLREKNVVKNTTHEKYDISAKKNMNISEFYDYDVALLQLEHPVRMSSFVRPICIPCTQQTSNALKLVSKTTCAQHEEILLKNGDQLSFLTNKDNIFRKKNATVRLDNNRGACIEKVQQVPGFEKVKVHEVVTDRFLCTGGRFPNRDYVACQGDSGGAVYYNYERRSVQVALVSWGTKDLCAGHGNMARSDDSSRDFHINLFKILPFLKTHLGNEDQEDIEPLKFLDI